MSRLKPLRLAFCCVITTLAIGSTLAQPPSWRPSESVPLSVDLGPLGATRHYEVTPLGTADVFGNGPYDLLLRARRVLPFRRWTAEGVPVYGQPQPFTAPSQQLALFDTPTGLQAVVYSAHEMRLLVFNRETQAFEVAGELAGQVPRGAACLTPIALPKGELAILFTKSDGKSRGVPGAHPHSVDFRPFDGSGIWRGAMGYHALGSLLYDTPSSTPETRYPIFPGERDFLNRCMGLTCVNYPSMDRRGVMGGASQGMFYYFENESDEGLALNPGVFLSDIDGNGMRHPGIHPTPVAIPNPATGDSDLLAGDTGSLWFYRFTGRFTDRGGPIYEQPTQALIENPALSVGALPVLSSGDLDCDGLVDLVAGNDAGHFLFVRNIGTKDVTRYDAPLRLEAGGNIFKVDAGYVGIQGPAESRWGYTCPTVYDWNHDGSPDLVYNSIQGDVSVLLQIPGSEPPSFERPVILKSDTMELHLVWRTQPAVTDWDAAGGRSCIIVNDQQNQFRRYWQVDDYNVTPGDVLRLTTGEPIQAHSRRFAGQLGRTKLQAIDWDGDGKIDLLAGTGRAASIPGPGGIPDDTFRGDRRQASVLFLRNAGSNQEPIFEYPRVMCFREEKLEMGVHSCSPLAIDLGRGQLDLLVGEEDGTVLYFPREDLSWVDVRNDR